MNKLCEQLIFLSNIRKYIVKAEPCPEDLSFPVEATYHVLFKVFYWIMIQIQETLSWEAMLPTLSSSVLVINHGIKRYPESEGSHRCVLFATV